MKLNIPIKKVHFIGINGIGMSAIAEMLDDLGIHVQGSCNVDNANARRLKKRGIPVFIGHDIANLGDADAIVVSTAISEDNVELFEARRRGLPVAHRSEILAEILRAKKSICVAGTHGKTTTSSLIASVLIKGGLRPSFIIGGILNSHASNAKMGSGDYVVVEADESDGSFLRLPTTVSVVTNIDPEHLDYYKTFENEMRAFETFVANTAFYGFSVLCIDHPMVRNMMSTVQDRRIITYGLDKNADVHADHIRNEKNGVVFDVFVRNHHKFHKIPDVSLAMLGRHNIQNALAAIAVATQMGIKDAKIKRALGEFKGIQRRLTLRGVGRGGVRVFDDYGHHPTEVAATLQAVREGTADRVIAVFQPHRYSRFRDLWHDFQACFSVADVVFITDVYAAGESPIDGVTATDFVAQSSHANIHTTTLETMEADLRAILMPRDTIVCLSAGSLSNKAIELAKILEKTK